MTLSAWKDQISISLKKEYQEKIDRNKEIFKNKSPTKQIYQRIDQIIENNRTFEEKAELHREKADKHEDKAEEFEAKAKRKNTNQKLRQKRDRKKELKEKLEKIKQNERKTEKEKRKELEKEYKEQMEERGYDYSKEDVESFVNRKIEKWGENKESKQDIKNELEEVKDKINEYEKIISSK